MEVILRFYRWLVFGISILVWNMADDSNLQYFRFDFLCLHFGIERDFRFAVDYVTFWISIGWENQWAMWEHEKVIEINNQ